MKELSIDNYYMLRWLDEYLMGHKGFICGGCFKNIFSKESVKDIDIFFHNEDDWQDAVAYFDSKTAGYGYDNLKVTEEKATYLFKYENEKVKAYKNIQTGITIELCRSIFGTPEEILKEFDFTITKFAYYREEVENEDDNDSHIETKLICHNDFWEHLFMKRLVTDDQIKYPVSTLERSYRYARYGYFPCKETKIKLATAINDLPKNLIEVSESLYDGVD